MNKKIIATDPTHANEIQALLKEAKAEIVTQLLEATSNKNIIQKVDAALVKNKLWDVALIVGDYYNTINDQLEIEGLKSIIVTIRDTMGELARLSTAPTTVVFGTSGWRGKIGEDFTVLNVHKVTRAIIDMMKTDEFLKTNGYEGFDEVRNRGVLVFRDNRYMGDVFMDAAMKELAAEGIKIYDAGECPTGVGSAVLTELKAAGSLNFTPSHNPMDYAGLKFNPADGGPADTNITNLIMEKTAPYMQPRADFVMAEVAYQQHIVSAADTYQHYILRMNNYNRGLINLAEIKTFLMRNKESLFILVDNMHGSSRGYIQAILGDAVLGDLTRSGAIQFVNTNEDYSFHGVKPEPSAKNQDPLIKRAAQKVATDPKRRLTLVVALDPDADRIRFGTADADIDMNMFGAIAYGYLMKQEVFGPVATTLPSSKFAVAIAKHYQQPFYEVLVGFKWFRPLRDAIVCYEESDGISFRGHTLEKDGIAGFLMALQIMKDQKMDIGQFYKKLQEEVGYYYPDKTGHEIQGISIEAWQKLRKEAESDLKVSYKVGDSVDVGGEQKVVRDIKTDDGLMVVFEDNSWLLVRSSGTEPKFRVYFEITSKDELTWQDQTETKKAYEAAGLAILKASLGNFGY